MRLLHRFDGTEWVAGAAVALTLWGPKLGLIVRYAERSPSGVFLQSSIGISPASERRYAMPGAGDAVFKLSGGRTFDLVAGRRWRFERTFIEAFGGWSFNLRGTALQDVSQSRVPVDQDTRDVLDVIAPGGLSFGAALGWGL